MGVQRLSRRNGGIWAVSVFWRAGDVWICKVGVLPGLGLGKVLGVMSVGGDCSAHERKAGTVVVGLFAKYCAHSSVENLSLFHSAAYE